MHQICGSRHFISVKLSVGVSLFLLFYRRTFVIIWCCTWSQKRYNPCFPSSLLLGCPGPNPRKQGCKRKGRNECHYTCSASSLFSSSARNQTKESIMNTTFRSKGWTWDTDGVMVLGVNAALSVAEVRIQHGMLSPECSGWIHYQSFPKQTLFQKSFRTWKIRTKASLLGRKVAVPQLIIPCCPVAALATCLRVQLTSGMILGPSSLLSWVVYRQATSTKLLILVGAPVSIWASTFYSIAFGSWRRLPSSRLANQIRFWA